MDTSLTWHMRMLVQAAEDMDEPAITVPSRIRDWACRLAKKTLTSVAVQLGHSNKLDRDIWSDFRKMVPNPTMDYKPNPDSYKMALPGTYVAFWDPSVFWPTYCPLKCIYCGSTSDIKAEWPSREKGDGGFFPIYSVGGVNWIMCRLFKHTKCTVPRVPNEGGAPPDRHCHRSWHSLNPLYLASLPSFVVEQLPGRITRKQGVDKACLFMICYELVKGNASSVARMCREAHMGAFLDHQLVHGHHVEAYNLCQEQFGKQRQLLNVTSSATPLVGHVGERRFERGHVGMRSVYCARHAECYVPLISSKCVYLLMCFFGERVQVPSTLLTKENEKLFQSKISSSYVRDLFVENNEINQAYMSNLVMSQFGEVLCFDATFRDAKRIHVQGEKVRMIYVLGFQALTLQQDMRCMILVISLAQTTALSTV